MKQYILSIIIWLAALLILSSFSGPLIPTESKTSTQGIFLYKYPFAGDSIRKKWTTRKALPVDSANVIARVLLDSNPVFKENWYNNAVFFYSNNADQLPEKVRLDLLNNNEEFLLTWYGNLFWGYGIRKGHFHAGLDISLNTGDTVAAAFDGVVRYIGFKKKGYGHCLVIRHLNGLETLYGHLSKICVDSNQFVKAGQMVGLGGSSGKSTGPHLHFETRYRDVAFNPFLIIDSLSHKLRSDTITLDKKEITYHPNLTPKYKKGSGSYVPPKNVNIDPSKIPQYYTVKKGDTIWAICSRYGISQQKLMNLNGLKSDKLQIGQKLKLK